MEFFLYKQLPQLPQLPQLIQIHIRKHIERLQKCLHQRMQKQEQYLEEEIKQKVEDNR